MDEALKYSKIAVYSKGYLLRVSNKVKECLDGETGPAIPEVSIEEIFKEEERKLCTMEIDMRVISCEVDAGVKEF